MTQLTKDPVLAAQYLKEGKVVALPTETVYGLGASIESCEALNEIYRLKKRPPDNPLIVHCADLEMIDRVAHITDDFLKLYNAFMPGPLTVLLKKKGISDLITRGLGTVGIRVPAHPLFQQVLRALKAPIAAPSANLSGKPSSTIQEHVIADFSPDLPLILDGGACVCGIESTIINIFDEHGVILRPGAILKQDLERVLDRPFEFVTKQAPLQAPGMKYRHYAPLAKVIVVKGADQLPSEARFHLVMAQKQLDYPYYQRLSEDNLYAAFRQADSLGLKRIYLVIDGDIPEGLRNRIEKASC